MTESSAEQLQKKPAKLTPETLIRVLQVDDDADFLKTSKRILEMQDSFQVESALSVEEAMKKMGEKLFDVIVSDYIMPGKDGLEFLRELRESGNNIPFILFTGKGREIVAIKALNLGANQYVNKIGKPEAVYSELTHGISTVVKGKKAEEELVHLSSAVKMSTDGIMISDLNGKLLDVNEASLKMYGTDDKRDLIGKNAVDLIVPEDREKVLVGVKEALKKGYYKRLECHVTTKDGSKIPVEMSLTIMKVPDGKPIGLVGIARDITERKHMEKALQESEERFRQVAENSGEWIWEVDANGLYTYTSPVVEKIFGYKPEELVGKKHFYDLFHPEDQQDLTKSAFQTFAEKSSFHDFINRNVHKNGNIVWLSTSGVPIVDNEGTFMGYRGSDRNITEWKNAVEALRQSEGKCRELINGMNDTVWVIDFDGKIIDVNNAAVEVLGYSREELLSIGLTGIDSNLKPEEIKALVEGMPADEIQVFETVHTTKDGKKIPVEISSSLVTYQGKKAILSIARDITERKKTDEKLKESERKYRLLTENTSDVIYIQDMNLNVTYASPSVEKLSGYTPEELLKLRPEKFMTPESFERGLADFKEAITSAAKEPDYEIPIKQYEYVCKDGSTIWGELKMKLLRDSNNKLVGIQGTIRDITERKEAEEKLNRIMNELMAINEKLSVVGKLTRHDARNKLSVIANSAYLAKQKLTTNHTGLEYLGDIESAVDQMEKIFDFARTYEMLGVEELCYMNVEKSVDEAAILFSGLATVKLVNECMGLTVRADSLLRQLFYNLVDDTLKHGEKVNQIKVYYKEGTDQLQLIYEDDGVGIPENEKEKIFEEGYGKGTGYGLYLIKKICETYGWTIQETGVPCKGVQFIMTIPKTNKKGKILYRFDNK